MNMKRNNSQLLNGKWNFLPDPCENHAGFWGTWYKKTPCAWIPEEDYAQRAWWEADVPGCWEIQFQNLQYYSGAAWYARDFDLQNVSSEGANTFLHFEGVNSLARVWLNEIYLGEHHGGYTPFDFNVSDIVKKEGNFLVVRVDNREGKDSPVPFPGWKGYGGIHREVFLYQTNKVKIDNVFPYTISISGKSAEVGLKVETVQFGSCQKYDLKYDVIDKNGRVVKSGTLKSFHAGGTLTSHVAEFSLADALLWSPDAPDLYVIELECIVDGKISDAGSVRFGVRTITTDGTRICLNGREVFIKGINRHDDHPDYGKAIPRSSIEEDLKMIKSMGFNGVRLPHYPHQQSELDLCDELGLLVFAENQVLWTADLENPLVRQRAMKQLEEMVKRDRHHPCIVLWSRGNEIHNKGNGIRLYFREARELIERLDNTRLISHDEPQELIYMSDTINLHNYSAWYTANGKTVDLSSELKEKDKYPEKPIFITELGAEAELGQKGTVKWSETYQANVIEETIKMICAANKFAGFFIWVFADFCDPSRNCHKHQMDKNKNAYNRKGVVDERRNLKLSAKVVSKLLKNISSRDGALSALSK